MPRKTKPEPRPYDRLLRTFRVMPRGERPPTDDEMSRALVLVRSAPEDGENADYHAWMAWARRLSDEDSDMLWSVAVHAAIGWVHDDGIHMLHEALMWGQAPVAVVLLRHLPAHIAKVEATAALIVGPRASA